MIPALQRYNVGALVQIVEISMICRGLFLCKCEYSIDK